ncbi:hypothetical protein HYW55_06350 [Candidatus Gottesmanbacteria bacterium]|nr:hypothetical protein [Candidatus Gottesmanbacteria bacterium]
MVKDEVTVADFQKIDFRVGKVTTAEKLAGSDNLLRLNVDFGTEVGQRQILTGIAKWYTPTKLSGKKFVFVVNMSPKKMMGEESQGMILCADSGDKAILIPVNSKIPEGTIVR